MSDRKALIRLASTLPKGSEERKAILTGLQKHGADRKDQKKALRQIKALGLFTERDVEEAYGEYLAGIAEAKKALGTLHDMLKEEGFDASFIKGIERSLNAAEDRQLDEDVHDLMEHLR